MAVTQRSLHHGQGMTVRHLCLTQLVLRAAAAGKDSVQLPACPPTYTTTKLPPYTTTKDMPHTQKSDH